MNIKVTRDIFTPDCTLGKMYLNGEFYAHTLEDTYRGQLDNEADKVYGKTAIPCGTYKVVATMSNRFKKVLPLLSDVKGFEGVRIHGGNTDADTLGCILIGKNTNGTDRISDCKERVETLTELIQAAGEAVITVENVSVV